MRIDLHAHVSLPRNVAALANSRSRAMRFVATYGTPPTDPADLFAFMDRQAIDAAVVSSMLPLDPGRRVAHARLVNDELAELVSQSPDRLGAMALLPLADTDEALKELERSLDALQLDGVLLPTNVAGRYLGDPGFDPLFDELDRRGAYVLVHPTLPPYRLPLPQYTPSYFEMGHETTRAIFNMAFSGGLERWPRIRFQLVHLGGTLPVLASRVPRIAEDLPERDRVEHGWIESLPRLFFDTAVANDLPSLQTLLGLTSIDHVVFGSDWPLFGTDRPDASLQIAGLSASEQSQIDGPNAAQLVPRLANARADVP
jgi:predicted TIM-barrel fold metal-dependent hydrolase